MEKQQNDSSARITPEELLRRKKSIGELVFDRSVYTGIGFGVNEVGSIIFTGMFQRGIGKNLFERMSVGLAKTFNFKEKTYLYHGKPRTITPKDSGSNLLLWFSLTLVGTLLVVPMKYLEDHKAGIVKWLNHKLDKNAHTPEDIAKRDAEVERAIACEPAQTWPSLIKGRIVGFLTSTTLALSLGKERTEDASNVTDRWITNGAKKLNNMMGGDKNSRLGKVIETEGFHYYARLMAPETIGCVATSITQEVASKFFARKKPVVKNPELCASNENTASLEAKPAESCTPCKSDKIKKKQCVNKREESYAKQVSLEGSSLAPSL